MNIRDWFYGQKVSQGDMDEAFEWVEDSVWNLAADTALVGIHEALSVLERAVPDLLVRVTGPGYAHGKIGERIYVSAEQNPDCSVDEYGSSTAVLGAGNEKWISVFVRFKRDPQDPTIDNNGVQVYQRQLESFEVFVRQGAEDTVGAATRPPILPDAILLADINLIYAQTEIENADIDFSRREDWVRLTGTTISEFISGTPKDAVTQLFALVDTAFGGGSPFTFSQDWAGGGAPKGPTPPISNVGEALNGIVYDLARITTDSGTYRIGSNEFSSTYVSWPAGTLQSVLYNIAGALNGHIGGGAPQHPASAITTTPSPSARFAISAFGNSVISEFSGYRGQITNENGDTADVVRFVDYALIVNNLTEVSGGWTGTAFSKGASFVAPGDGHVQYQYEMTGDNDLIDGESTQTELEKLSTQLGMCLANDGFERPITDGMTLDGPTVKPSNLIVGALYGGSGENETSIFRSVNFKPSVTPASAVEAPFPWQNKFGSYAINDIAKGLWISRLHPMIYTIGPNERFIEMYFQTGGFNSFSISRMQLMDTGGSPIGAAEVPLAIATNENYVFVLTSINGVDPNCRLRAYTAGMAQPSNPEPVAAVWETDLLGHDPGAIALNRTRIISLKHTDNSERVACLFAGDSSDGDDPIVIVDASNGSVLSSGNGTSPAGADYYFTGGVDYVKGELYFIMAGNPGAGDRCYLCSASTGNAASGPLSYRMMYDGVDYYRELILVGHLALCSSTNGFLPIKVYDFIDDNATTTVAPDTNITLDATGDYVVTGAPIRLYYDGSMIWIKWLNNEDGGQSQVLASFHPSEIRRGDITLPTDFRPRLFFLTKPQTSGFAEVPGRMIYWGGGIWNFADGEVGITPFMANTGHLR